jgi:sulfopyruvate decarboxylase TPP-binding subunit
MTGAFGALIDAVLSLLDLLNISIPFVLLKFDKLQQFIPANVPLGGDAPVKLTLQVLTANVLDDELVAEGQLA